MSFSNVSGTQRQQQEEGLKKVLAIGLLGSALLHGVALTLSLSLVKPAEFAEDAIEIVMLDEPKVEETQPEPAIQEKVSPPPETLKPEPPPEPTPPEEPSVAATPPPIPQEPPVPPTPPPTPQEPPVPPTPPPETKEELPTETPPPTPEPSPPPKEDSNSRETPKSSSANEREKPSPDPLKSEPPVRTSRPKGAESVGDITNDAGNSNSSDSPEKDKSSSSASAGSGESSDKPLDPSSGPIQPSPVAGPPVKTNRPGGRDNSGSAIADVGNVPSPGSPVGSASNSSSGGGGNGDGGSSQPFGSDSGRVPKRTNPEPGGSPSGPKGTPGGTCISDCGKPNYPSAARKQGREGRVVLIFDIDPNGKALKIEILTSSNHDDLDREAIKALEKWKFASSENGLQRQTTAIKFRLED